VKSCTRFLLDVANADRALIASVGYNLISGTCRIGVESRTRGDSIFHPFGRGVSGAIDNWLREAWSRPAATSGARRRAKRAPSSGQSLLVSSIPIGSGSTYRYSLASVPHTDPFGSGIVPSSLRPVGDTRLRSSRIFEITEGEPVECDIRFDLSRT
jgi:hypothetical protein